MRKHYYISGGTLMLVTAIIFLVNPSNGPELKIFHQDTTYLTYYPRGICDHRMDLYHLNDSVLANGTCRIYYDKEFSKLKYERGFRAYQKHGEYNTYSQKGNLSEEMNYRNGQLHGVQRKYQSADGDLRFENTYDNGKMIRETSYHRNGQLQHERTEKGNGIVSKWYHLNGNIATENRYVDGKKVGDNEVTYFSDGKTEQRRFCKGGICDSSWLFYPNQRIKERFFFRDGSVVRRYSYRENGFLNGLTEYGSVAPYKHSVIQYKEDGSYNHQIRMNVKKTLDADYDKNGNLIRHLDRGDLMHWDN